MTMQRRWVLSIMAAASLACSNEPSKPGQSTGGSGSDQPTGAGGNPAADAGGGRAGAGVDAAPSMDATPGDPAPVSACGAGPHLLTCDPMMPMPKSIKDAGIYPAIPDLSKHADPLIAYSPEPALWSDSLSKERFLDRTV